MAEEEIPSFDEKAIRQSLEAAQQHGESLRAEADAGGLVDGALTVAGGCVSVTVKNGQVCVNLPFPISKKVCLPVPSWIPNGTAAEACLQICTKWGVPCGVEVTVSVAGKQIVKKGFGCSC